MLRNELQEITEQAIKKSSGGTKELSQAFKKYIEKTTKRVRKIIIPKITELCQLAAEEKQREIRIRPSQNFFKGEGKLSILDELFSRCHPKGSEESYEYHLTKTGEITAKILKEEEGLTVNTLWNDKSDAPILLYIAWPKTP